MNKKTLSIVLFLSMLTILMVIEKNILNLTDIHKVLDKMIFYNRITLINNLKILGTEGRRLYYYFHKIDYLFIISFGFMQIVLLDDRLKKINLNIMNNNGLFLIPILSRGLADIGENLIIDIILSNYPSINQMLVNLAYLMTFIKWVSLVAIIIEIIYITILVKKNNMPEVCTNH